jgi:hypothetical protein
MLERLRGFVILCLRNCALPSWNSLGGLITVLADGVSLSSLSKLYNSSATTLSGKGRVLRGNSRLLEWVAVLLASSFSGPKSKLALQLMLVSLLDHGGM